MFRGLDIIKVLFFNKKINFKAIITLQDHGIFVRINLNKTNSINASHLILSTDHLVKLSNLELTNLLNRALELGTTPIFIKDNENRLRIWMKN